MRIEEFDAGTDVVGDGVEFLLERGPLSGDLAEPCSNTRGVDLGIGGEVEQIFFLNCEPCNLPLDLLAKLSPRASLIFKRALEPIADCRDEFGTEGDRLVVLLDCNFDTVVRGVRGIAGVVLNASAEEVFVGGSVGSRNFHLDHASVDFVLKSASTAPEGALEIVVVLSLALASISPGVQKLLNSVKGLVVDEAWVPPLEPLALVADFAEVIAVPEHCVDLGVRNRPGRPTSCRSSGQASISQFISDVLERVVTGIVKLECELYERSAVLVYANATELAPFHSLNGVQKPDGRPSERPAVLGLLAHLVGDVGSVFAGAVFVEGRQDAVHELTHWRRIDRFRCRDEGNAALLQVGHHDGVVGAVASEAGELVDDDVVDVLVAANAFEHLLEGDALTHLGSRDPSFDVLGNHGQAELLSLALAGLALGWDGNAFRIVVGVDLTF